MRKSLNELEKTRGTIIVVERYNENGDIVTSYFIKMEDAVKKSNELIKKGFKTNIFTANINGLVIDEL